MKKHYFTQLLILLFFTASAQYAWVNKNPFSGTPRFKSAEFSVNGKGYVVGGRTASSPLTYIRDTWEYDPTTDTWTQKSNYPFSMVQPASFTIGNKGYIVGGQNSSFAYVNSTYEYDPINDTWTSKAAFPESGVGGCFEFVVNGKAYVGGGARNSSQPSTTMYEYNAATDTWTSKASYPGNASVNPVGFSIGNFGYAGSGTTGAGTLFKDFYKYNPATDTWTPIAAFPGKVRFEAMVFVIDGKAYLGGGARNFGSNYFALNDMYVYDPVADTWSPAPSLPGLPTAHSANFVINNVGYLVNGYDYDGDSYYKTVSAFGSCTTISGLEENPVIEGTQLAVYPNPATNQLNVNIQGDLVSQIQFDVYSVDGKLIKTGNSSQNRFELNTATFSNGVYILSVKDKSGQMSSARFEILR